MQKVGLWSNPQFNSVWEQSELVSLTWVYCICYYSSGASRWPLAAYFPALTNKCQAATTQTVQRIQ
jgi:hypothetical protein